LIKQLMVCNFNNEQNVAALVEGLFRLRPLDNESFRAFPECDACSIPGELKELELVAKIG